MKITIHVRPDAVRALRGDGGDPAADELRDVAHAFGSRLEPLHPGATDADLAASFTMEVADSARAAQAAERLRRLPSVESAYVKPAEEPPAP